MFSRMDVDTCAGGDGTRKKAELAGTAEGTMDVVPLEMYDSARAKIAANLRWLFAKAYGIGKLFNFNSFCFTSSCFCCLHCTFALSSVALLLHHRFRRFLISDHRFKHNLGLFLRTCNIFTSSSQ